MSQKKAGFDRLPLSFSNTVVNDDDMPTRLPCLDDLFIVSVIVCSLKETFMTLRNVELCVNYSCVIQ
jgi:hypothetical protein